jgi:bifunctional DNA-binding transcriptional regulator/antitoxin component of YhaV-PrlF toxin-antitoxin module
MRQHRSVVLVIPKPVCRDLGLAAGDYVQVASNRKQGVGSFAKIHLGVFKNVRGA